MQMPTVMRQMTLLIRQAIIKAILNNVVLLKAKDPKSPIGVVIL
jgi:hypothetical protein